MIVRLVLLIAACSLDVAATQRNLASGGRERNVLLPAFLIAKIGFWPTALLTKGAMIGLALFVNKAGFYDGFILANLFAFGFSTWRHRRKAKAAQRQSGV